MDPVARRVFPATGDEVGAVGLGCASLSQWMYADAPASDQDAVALLHAAVDLGATFLDTADVYGEGHNEALLGRALNGRRSEVLMASKVGLVVEDLATLALRPDGSPAHLRAAVEGSLRRLGADCIDLCYLHRVDPQVPLEDSWGALADLVTDGKLRFLGLSEVTVDQAEVADRVHPVAAVQSELSLWTRTALGEAATGSALPNSDVVGWCAVHDAAFVPYAPLGRGFLTGTVTRRTTFSTHDLRARHPRFAADARQDNLRIVDTLRAVAQRHAATPAQVALAWVLAQGKHVLPIPGTRNLDYLRENIASAALDLTATELIQLNAVPAATGNHN